MAGSVGATLDHAPSALMHGFAFGEDQGRYLVTASENEAAKLMEDAKKAGIPLTRLGTTGGDRLSFCGLLDLEVAALKSTNENWLPNYMAGKA